jgi:hypothetical protein
MKITKSDIDKLIKEEFQKMMEKRKLTSRLSQINEELTKITSDDSSINEVEAGGEEKVRSHAWTGEAGGDVKFKPEFEKIGSALKEDEEAPIEMGAGSEEMPKEENPMGEFEAKFAEIGKAIDSKLSSEAGIGAEPTATEPTMDDKTGDSDDNFEEVEVDNEPKAEDESFKVKEDVSATQHLNPEASMKSTGEPTEKIKGDVQESVTEPLEGHSVAQEVDADKVNDNMEKDKHVKESKDKAGVVITENKTTTKNIFTEGKDATKQAAFLAEMKRMQKFAGLRNDEE